MPTAPSPLESGKSKANREDPDKKVELRERYDVTRIKILTKNPFVMRF